MAPRVELYHESRQGGLVGWRMVDEYQRVICRSAWYFSSIAAARADLDLAGFAFSDEDLSIVDRTRGQCESVGLVNHPAGTVVAATEWSRTVLIADSESVAPFGIPDSFDHSETGWLN